MVTLSDGEARRKHRGKNNSYIVFKRNFNGSDRKKGGGKGKDVTPSVSGFMIFKDDVNGFPTPGIFDYALYARR